MEEGGQLPLDPERMAEGIRGEISLEILTSVLEAEDTGDTKGQLYTVSCVDFNESSEYLERLEAAELVEKKEQGGYKLGPRAESLAAHYRDRGRGSFPLSWDEKAILSELEEKGGYALTTELNDRYRSRAIRNLVEGGELESHELVRKRIVYLPEEPPSEGEINEALLSEI